MDALTFFKMHGAGNDFAVIDARTQPVAIDAHAARAIADRRRGIGCDQVILMEPAVDPRARVRMRIFNADGSEVAACGNASRCVAALLMREARVGSVVIETAAGLLPAEAGEDGLISVDLGPVRTAWDEIPLARPVDTLHLEIAAGPFADPVAVSVGNPHAVFFIDDGAAPALAALGPVIEHHPLFPEGTNVEAVTVQGRTRLRVRVWERGVGMTPACGTGAVAAAAAAVRRGLAEPRVEVVMDGGPLAVTLRPDGHAVLTGPIAISFTGVLDPSLLAGSEAR